MPKIKVSWLHFDLEFLKDDADLLGFEAFADYMVPLREEFHEREITRAGVVPVLGPWMSLAQPLELISRLIRQGRMSSAESTPRCDEFHRRQHAGRDVADHVLHFGGRRVAHDQVKAERRRTVCRRRACLQRLEEIERKGLAIALVSN